MSKKKTEALPVEEVAEDSREVLGAETTAPEAEAEAVCYVGPSIPGLVQRSTFFRNGLPEHFEKAVAKCPAFKGLLIPVSDLTTVNYGSVAILSREVLKWAGIKEV